MPLPPNPDEWTYRDAVKAVEQAAYGPHTGLGRTPAEARLAYEANRAFIEHRDFWQQGQRWIGPGSDPTLPRVARALTLRRVEPQFTPLDVLGEIVERPANALLKREPSIAFTPREPAGEKGAPSDAQAAEADAMRRHLAAWWDRERLWELMRLAVKRGLWAGRAGLRAWVPSGFLVPDDDGDTALPAGVTFAQALERIKLAAPLPNEAAVVTIDDTQERVGIVLWERTAADGKVEKVADIWRLRRAVTVDGIVDYATPPLGATVRQVSSRPGAPVVAMDLDAPYLPIAEMAGDPLITEPLRRQQDQASFANTLMTRVMETAGFPERTIIGSRPEGDWLEAPPPPGATYESKTIGAKTLYLHPRPRTVGSAVTAELHGYPVRTGDTTGGGATLGHTTPQIVYKEPTDPAYLARALEHTRSMMLVGAKQGHVLANGDAAPSGYSREQARSEFVDDLLVRRAGPEGMLRDVIAVVIATAQLMATADSEIAPDFLERFRVVVTLTIDAGPLSPDERRAILEEYGKGLRSRVQTMALLGTEDPDAELAAIGAEEGATLDRLTRIGETLNVLAERGTYDAGLRLLRKHELIDDEDIRALSGRDTDDLVDVDPDDEVAA